MRADAVGFCLYTKPLILSAAKTKPSREMPKTVGAPLPRHHSWQDVTDKLRRKQSEIHFPLPNQPTRNPLPNCPKPPSRASRCWSWRAEPFPDLAIAHTQLRPSRGGGGPAWKQRWADSGRLSGEEGLTAGGPPALGARQWRCGPLPCHHRGPPGWALKTHPLWPRWGASTVPNEASPRADRGSGRECHRALGWEGAHVVTSPEA